MKKRMYTVKEVATILGVCEMTVYRQVKSKQIPCKRVGRSIRISSDFIDGLSKNPITEVQKFIFG